MISVEFDPFELRRIDLLTQARTAYKRECRNGHDQIDLARADATVEYEGVFGEATFGKLFDLPVATFIGPAGDTGFDFVLCGFTVDVKFSRYRSGHFLIPHDLPLVADIGVFVTYGENDSTGCLVGYFSPEMFEASATRSEMWTPGTRGLAQSHMHPGERLRDWYEQNMKVSA